MQYAKEVKMSMEPGYQKSNEGENLLPNNDMSGTMTENAKNK